jgi:predicted transposase YbfD/YdcC
MLISEKRIHVMAAIQQETRLHIVQDAKSNNVLKRIAKRNCVSNAITIRVKFLKTLRRGIPVNMAKVYLVILI